MTLASRLLHSKIFWLASWLLWMGVIFYFSHQPGSHWPPDTSWSYFLERKGAHVIEYAVLTLLSLQLFSLFYPGESLKKIMALAVAWGILYGVSDELHQFFTPYRGAHVRDVIIDILGIFLGLLPVFAMLFRQRKRKKALR